jgi:hypothetical protein
MKKSVTAYVQLCKIADADNPGFHFFGARITLPKGSFTELPVGPSIKVKDFADGKLHEVVIECDDKGNLALVAEVR